MDFKLIPISKDSFERQCSILKLGGLTILLNCGWTESLDPKVLGPLIPHLNEIDLVLLTHGDVKHLGALPFLLTKYPQLTCPIICTEPVCRLGELSCVACLEDREKYRAPIEDLEVDDVLRIFMQRVTSINYRETFQTHVRGRTLAVSAFPAGGSLGSAYWTLQCGSLSVVYAVDCDLRHGRYLDGFELHRLLPSCRGAAHRWDVVITSPLPSIGEALPQRGANQAPQEGGVASKAMMMARSVREQLFLEETIGTLRRGGNVLIPADAVGWVPEVLLLLEAAWSQDRQLATNYPIIWMSSMGDMVLDQVKTRLEYMSKEVLADFEVRFGQNPFVFKNIRIFQTLEELCAVHPMSRPKVIVTTSPHLEGGDSRELFFKLSSDPRNLLWLLGVPPAGTLARTLLDDFVVKHGTRKEYRLQQHVKQPLPDEQLREYYEAKMQEMAEPDPLLDLAPPPIFKEESLDFTGDLNVKMEEGAVKDDPPTAKVETKVEVKAEVKVEAKLPVKKVAATKAATSALWAPLGWPNSRTVSHSEMRTEGDEYGHLLANEELKLWRAQDQEGNKYTVGMAAGTAGGEDGDADKIKEETAKVEDDVSALPSDTIAEWRDSLRVHFREPMHCETRDKMVRVACRIEYLPDSSMETKDLHTLVGMIAPKHVVILPAAVEMTTGPLLEKHFQVSTLADGAACPEVHSLDAEDPSLEFTLHGMKRKAQFLPEVWPKLSFLKTADGVKVARIRASLNAPRDGVDARVLELGNCTTVSSEAKGKSDGDSDDRLPRNGALFVGLSQAPLSLSGLKEQLSAAEWSRDDVEVEFKPSGGDRRRPWSARVVTADSKATLGWTESGGAGEDMNGDSEGAGVPKIRLEGVPGEEFFLARAALYRRCALI